MEAWVITLEVTKRFVVVTHLKFNPNFRFLNVTFSRDKSFLLIQSMLAGLLANYTIAPATPYIVMSLNKRHKKKTAVSIFLNISKPTSYRHMFSLWQSFPFKKALGNDWSHQLSSRAVSCNIKCYYLPALFDQGIYQVTHFGRIYWR